LPSCVLLTIALAGLATSAWSQPPAPSTESEAQGPTLEQAEDNVRAIRATLKDPAAPSQAWGVLMMSEIVVLRLKAQKAAGGGTVDEAALAEEQRKLRERVSAEWKATRPGDSTPYLAEMQGSVPPERMDDAVLGLLPRFPDDPTLLGRALQILSRREQAKRGSELIEAALERHPERSELYGLAINFFGEVNETRRRELTETWIERLPGDANALRAYLSEPPSSRDPRQSARRVERFVTTEAAGGANLSRVETCGWLLTADHGAYRADAVRCLNQAAEQTRDAGLRAKAAGFLASAGEGTGSGDGGLERSLAELPPERRQEAILNAAYALGEGQCERKLSLFKLLPKGGGERAGSLSNRFGALRGCQTDPPARAAYLEAFVHGPAEDLPNLLGRWFTKINGQYQEDFGLAPPIVAALEARLPREGGKTEVWRALDEAYQLAGWEERRAAHLAAWIGKPLNPPSGEDLIWLADFQAGHDGPQAGIDTLRLAWRRTHDVAVASGLADLLVEAGKIDEFTALTDELAGADLETQETNLARLLRARGALLHHDPDSALAQYEAFVERAQYVKPEEAAEYLLTVAGVRGAPAAQQAAQALCTKPSMQSAGATPTQCAARLLAGLGHSQGALQLLEAAAQRAPEDLRLQASFALAAEQAGAFDRAEPAYRRMLAADPKSETCWSGLGRIAESRGDPRELETLLRQAEQALGAQPANLVLSLARTYLEAGQPARAIEILNALRERFPGAYLGEDELRQAYEALSRATPVAYRTGGSGGSRVAPPSAEDLRAAHEGEAAMLGLNGTVDEAKGREIVKRLAQQGNAYANIRLSIWQQAGTQGCQKNPRQADATARPYLPALQAAAEAGEPYAEYLWGTVLLRGIGVPKAAAEGGAWLRKAAERNEPWALNNLGWMAENGDGASLNLQEALRWYRRGAEAGNVHSMESVAQLRLLSEEPGLHQKAEGFQWLAKAADRGLPEAMAWHGSVLLYGLPGAPRDPARARLYLEKAAAAGEGRAIYDLAAALLSGAGGPADEKRAVALLEKEAAQGNSRAMLQLAWQSTLGQGTARDGNRAEQWIEKAAAWRNDDISMILGAHAEQGEVFRRYFTRGLSTLEKLAASGDAFAGGLAARFYQQQDSGLKQDFARAVALARPAATAGSTEAMRVLGWAYRLGWGIEADQAQAAAWWRRGAEGGNTYCMMWYSQMLLHGDGGKQDTAAGLAWLQRAGERGNAWSIRDLAHFYDAGAYGLPRDPNKTAYWMRKALAFNDEEARGWLIAHRMLE
jgi:TPR repeat protein/predicted Zn-dependent protease